MLTGSRARPAKTHGAFGLVGGWLTNAYHPADLSLNLPSGTFTKHYHRGEDRGIDLAVGIEVRWCGRVAIVM